MVTVRAGARLAVLALVGGVGLVPLLAACATLVGGGGTQRMNISSTPSAALVSVDGTQQGQTPTMVTLSRKQQHQVRVELQGYQPYEVTLEKKVNGWVWGNIVFGGIIGLIVDASTGAMWKLTPDQISAALSRTGVSGELRGDVLFVGVTLRPDALWERIATFERISPTDVQP